MPRKKVIKQNIIVEDDLSNKPLCFISKEIAGEIPKNDIRADVCNDLSAEFKDEDGNYYCVLHYPSDEKILTTNFDSFFRQRLENNYRNFQYTYFPNVGIFSGRTILNDVNLAHSTFSGEAYFNSSKFKGRLIFNNARFKESAHFGSSIFEQEINFENTIFEKGANFNSTAFNGRISFSKSLFEGKAEFRETTFNEIVFFDETFFDKTVDFTCASFNYSEFTKTIFNSDVTFTSVKFSDYVNFLNANFLSIAYFTSATFLKNVFFNFSKFNENARIYFIQTNFNGAISFVKADIDGYLHFEGGKREIMKKGSVIQEGITSSFIGKDSLLILEHARIKNPEKIVFHSVRLQPSWFINQEGTKKFVFTNCRWKKSDGGDISANSEISALENRRILNPNKLLTKTCWQLADNHEEVKSFRKSSLFRQIAQESERREDPYWKMPFRLGWWYWLSSYYGEMPLWALYILLYLVLLIFPGIFYWTNFQTCPKEQPISISLTEDKMNQECQQNGEKCKCKTSGLFFEDAISHSLTTATLQNTDYRKPVSFWAEFWTIFEKILAPLQAALLALAIRRKFMR